MREYVRDSGTQLFRRLVQCMATLDTTRHVQDSAVYPHNDLADHMCLGPRLRYLFLMLSVDIASGYRVGTEFMGAIYVVCGSCLLRYTSQDAISFLFPYRIFISARALK